MSKIGFIGLGVMGQPMAANLIAAGHQLFLLTRRTVPEALAKAGGIGLAGHVYNELLKQQGLSAS